MRIPLRLIVAVLLIGPSGGTYAQSEEFERWPTLKSTFPSTGGGGITIKGYDPVISKGKCITTFMAVEGGSDPEVYPSLIEFDAIPVAGGILCANGKWRAFDGGASGTTSYRVFFKDGIFRGSP
ncbi:MAG: hypothetical protein ACK4TL_14670 [Hyphomicrobiaceae bacterium]